MTETAKNCFVIRVYGDFLGMPRVESGIACDQTYAELFSIWCQAKRPASMVKLYNRSIGAADILKLSELCAMDSVYFGKGQGILVVQCGIVDCAPRPVPPFVRNNMIAKLPGGARGRVLSVWLNLCQKN